MPPGLARLSILWHGRAVWQDIPRLPDGQKSQLRCVVSATISRELSRSPNAIRSGANRNGILRGDTKMTGVGLVMRNLTFAVSTAIATTIFGLGAASAADLPVKAYTKAPAAIVAVYNWTGFYVGANVGYGWGESSHQPDLRPLSCRTQLHRTAQFGQRRCEQTRRRDRGRPDRLQLATRTVAGRAGGRLPGTDIRSTSDFSGLVGVTRFVHTEQRLDWLATFRGRIGVLAAPQFLLYATGGLAVGQVKTNASLTTTVANNIPGCVAASIGLCIGNSDTSTKVGWTVGGGAEWALTSNWSIKAEYLYVDLGRSNSTGFDARFAVPLPLFASTKDDFHIARVGVNYRFGGPVVAKYLSSPNGQQFDTGAAGGLLKIAEGRETPVCRRGHARGQARRSAAGWETPLPGLSRPWDRTRISGASAGRGRPR